MIGRAWRQITEIIGLQTPRGRVICFLAASAAIFVAPYDWLAGLSLWQRLGIDAPSIGLTRAYWHILHLDPVAAWQRNRLIFVVLAIGLPMLARDAFVWYYGRQSSVQARWETDDGTSGSDR